MTTPSLPTIAALTAIGLLAPAAAPAAEWFADVEVGTIVATRNDVRIPGDGGTTFSLVDDLSTNPTPYARARAGVSLGGRHAIFATWVPVRLDSHGVLPEDVSFAGATFAAGDPVSARYVFDSYRLTYRYGLVRSERLDLDVGATAFLRDAAISLQGASFGEKTNVGLVPLLSFRLAWRFAPPVSLVIDGDALASPQGRAEDVLLGVEWEVRPGVSVRAGYRVIEGGSDGASVYNFAFLNHFGLGLAVRL